MCGRVVQHGDPRSYAELLEVVPEQALPNAPAHFNGAPTQDFLVGRLHPKTGARTLDLLRWGLIPSWAKDRTIGARLINARCESLDATAAFRKAFASRRCLLPVEAFYEWRRVGKARLPYAIGMRDASAFTLAGLWENWRDPESGEWTRTFTIVTTAANELVARLHERMPVIVAPEDRRAWLEGDEPQALLRPYPADTMCLWPVSTRVNSVRNERADLVERVEEQDAGATLAEPVPDVANSA